MKKLFTVDTVNIYFSQSICDFAVSIPSIKFSCSDFYHSSSWMFCKFLRNHIWRRASFIKKRKILHNVTFFRKLSPHISCVHISKSNKCFDVKFSSYYFQMKTKVLADFQICISVLYWVNIELGNISCDNCRCI